MTLISGLLLSAALAACGGASSSTKTAPADLQPSTRPAATAPSSPNATAAGDDTALAASMLLTRSDFPFDYLESQSHKNADTNPLNSCRPGAGSRTGSASGNDWLFDGQSPAISETVTLFATESGAIAGVAAAAALIDCAVRAINDGTLNAAGVELSGATRTDISVDAGGDTSAAFQIHAVQKYAGQSAQGTAEYTLVFASHGRAVYEIVARGSGTPFDPEELSGFVQDASARVRQKL